MSVHRDQVDELAAELADDRVDPKQLRAVVLNLVDAVDALHKRVDALQVELRQALSKTTQAARTPAGRGKR